MYQILNFYFVFEDPRHYKDPCTWFDSYTISIISVHIIFYEVKRKVIPRGSNMKRTSSGIFVDVNF